MRSRSSLPRLSDLDDTETCAFSQPQQRHRGSQTPKPLSERIIKPARDQARHAAKTHSERNRN